MTIRGWWTRDTRIAVVALTAIAASLIARFILRAPPRLADIPLIAAIVVGGLPLLVSLGRRVLAREFGSDFLAGLSILTAVVLGEYLVAVVVILMLSGGQALEERAIAHATSVLQALAQRSPSHAHVQRADGTLTDVPLADVDVGAVLVVLPHEICPVDGIVRSGSSTMDESYLSGEPFLIRKTIGAPVISGAINGDSAMTITAARRAVDSRYASIMRIVAAVEQNRPPMRRLADRLGGWYTPLAVAVAIVGWVASGDPDRALSVLVIATPCPLLLAIPVAIIGAVSLSAKRGILIKDAALLERVTTCRTVIFDKTGTLTLGRPVLTDTRGFSDTTPRDILAIAASLEQYSKHPLAAAVTTAAAAGGLSLPSVSEMSEIPGEGLTGVVAGRRVRITGRPRLSPSQQAQLPPTAGGLECVVLVDDRLAGLFTFRDAPRGETAPFVRHLAPKHDVTRVLIVSGDRESEVRYLASEVGIDEIYAKQTPEDKVAIVTRETAKQPTLFVGDGLNDAPAMLVATAGIALGQHHEVTAEAAGAVILEGSLGKVDELLHIARRTKRLALQSAVGGMVLSGVGMILAAAGWLPALMGVISQEVIDVAAVLNAVRASWSPPELTDYSKLPAGASHSSIRSGVPRSDQPASIGQV